MFGFFIGTACLIGLFAVARGSGRGARARGCRGRHGGRFWFHRVLDRLDTTPGQEKVIRAAVEDLQDEAASLRREARNTRVEIAAALRAGEVDEALLEQVFAKHDALLARLRESALRTTTQVHAALDDRQRAKLADMIESGPFGYAWR
jgi:Spy/CpxP family protein refolding chaperone